MLPHLFAMHDDPVRQVVDLVAFRESELVGIQFMNVTIRLAFEGCCSQVKTTFDP